MKRRWTQSFVWLEDGPEAMPNPNVSPFLSESFILLCILSSWQRQVFLTFGRSVQWGLTSHLTDEENTSHNGGYGRGTLSLKFEVEAEWNKYCFHPSLSGPITGWEMGDVYEIDHSESRKDSRST